MTGNVRILGPDENVRRVEEEAMHDFVVRHRAFTGRPPELSGVEKTYRRVFASVFDAGRDERNSMCGCGRENGRRVSESTGLCSRCGTMRLVTTPDRVCAACCECDRG